MDVNIEHVVIILLQNTIAIDFKLYNTIVYVREHILC